MIFVDDPNPLAVTASSGLGPAAAELILCANSIVSNTWGYNAGHLARAMFFSAGGWGCLLAAVAARWPHAVSAIASSSRPLHLQRAAGSSGVASEGIPCESYYPQTLDVKARRGLQAYFNARSC